MADIKEIYNLLKNPVRKTVYDKYMDTSSEVNINYLSPYQQIKFIINTGSSYMIILLLVLINVDKKSLKKGIELVFINLVIFIMLELYYIMNDTDKTDLIDTIFPRLTIQERGELQKMLIGPLMFIIIKYTQLFVQNSEEITYLQLLKTFNLLKNELEKKVLQNKEIGQDKDMELSQDQINIVNKIQELKQQILNYYKNHYKKMGKKTGGLIFD
ncbi:hypothetical protein PPERSA_11285 [Pseudocohnilembus persalinus]|uniref:Uncharacterized protein n=1 Tax=Pseudocohnilembus persalinus TaxID=266149 RepID=A0A0V0QPS6_PSEPJ|nr:hypothetical protein PPERSA_11285 [Pseudocohnilembus persalinus]|eukprot:KRX04161.1 hypothetical protein PPERSA_11285 [Pseudocohnilembus persalinus]